MGKVDHNPTQNQRILDYLDKYGSITHLEAIRDISVLRLASRISDLKRRGYLINSEWVVVTNKYGEKCRIKKYSMAKE
jgi:hypothetical protein